MICIDYGRISKIMKPETLCPLSNYCKSMRAYAEEGSQSGHTSRDILDILELISHNDDLRSFALSCRLVNLATCYMHPDNPKHVDPVVRQALKKL